jgi:hypothetical protein
MTTQINQDNIQPSTLAELGSGPTVTNIQITNSSYVVLDDTAVSTSGGYIKITGTNFASGCEVIIGTTNATAVALVSSTVLNVQVPALSAGTYVVYVVNIDGSVAIRVNGLTFSGTPTWVTGSTLTSGAVNVAISIQLSATGDAPLTYSLASGSSLPSGLTLTSGGLLSGTITGITVETIYNFTIDVTDAQLQESPRSFSITISVSDQYFMYNTALLSATALTLPFNNDASTNNFAVTVVGDTRPNNFGPYTPGYYSNFFDGTGDYLTLPSNQTQFTMGTGDFTIEMWVNVSSLSAARTLYDTMNSGDSTGTGRFGMQISTGGVVQLFTGAGSVFTSGGTLIASAWYHIAYSRQSNSGRLYVNGVQVNSTYTDNNNYVVGTTNRPVIGVNAFNNSSNPMFGFISNLRVVKETAVYTSAFTPPTQPLTAIANTSLLTCQSNRLIDTSTNNFTITRVGDTLVSGFDPFVPDTNYSTYGSTYFDGTGDYLTLPGSTTNLYPGSGNFTIEFWYWTSVTPGGYINIFSYGASGSALRLFLFTTNSLIVWTGATPIITANNAHVASQWNHVAIVRSGTTVTLYVNGTSVGTNGSNSTNYEGSLSIAFESGQSLFTGYISNWRLVKGTAVYTANFTPPTSPLTAIANTQLLTCQSATFIDNSTNNFTITVNGNSTPRTVAPFTPTATTGVAYSPSVYGGSMYFDGSGDYLSCSNSALAMGTGTFTWEAWVYWTTGSGYRQIFSTRTSAGASTAQGSLALVATTNYLVWFTNASIITTSVAVPSNTWAHVALVRNGSSLVLYLNGVNVGTATNSDNLTASVFSVGANNDGSEPFAGYISDVRVTRGQALFTSNFAPPVSPLTSIQNTSLVLNGTSAGVYDMSMMNDYETVGNSSLITNIEKYGNSSLYFDGTGDYLLAPASQNIVFRTGNFTIECWLYLTATGVDDGVIIENRSSGASTSGFAFNTRGVAGGYKINFYVGGFNITPNSVTYSSWNHIAVTRSSGTVRIFLNGVIDLTVTINTNLTDSSMTIGQSLLYANSNITGYIDDLRITKGVARYTANFTPPSSPFITS